MEVGGGCRVNSNILVANSKLIPSWAAFMHPHPHLFGFHISLFGYFFSFFIFCVPLPL